MAFEVEMTETTLCKARARPAEELQEAVMLIERATYDLAETARGETISELIAIAADLQRVVDGLMTKRANKVN
ncbi:hypothetical protein [Sulfitobacter sp. M368]|jgi:hypothetical protein|uniref:hypothetical protein n=1 Tax=Sulfitobacter sp. M368 TaxID=2867021 RepID=UPI0021A6D6DA|nr:hypothetical protein [Sulfitobacter sp. M368]UWR16210.1 hypothetical protein K3754_04770 [Sulfitobacter sp. M368]